MTSEAPLHWVVFDTEIPELPTVDRAGRELTSLNDRFQEARLRGDISCAVLWDSRDRWLPPFGPEETPIVADRLEEADVIVSYNGARFDIPLLENAVGRSLRLPNHIDILAMIWDAMGNGQHGENSLDAVAKRTLGRAKIGSGEHATTTWTQFVGEEGRRAATTLAGLIRYCQWDVVLTRDLFEHIRDHGSIEGVNGPVRFNLPDWWRRLR